ncbi:MAG: DUF2927 domain-containing protein [Pseudomonadota bacterium]
MAQEFVKVSGRLNDEAFYRLVACAAPPGGACQKPMLRWDETTRQSIGIMLASVPPDLPPYKRRLFDAGIDNAVAQINGLDAGVQLVRVVAQAEITIVVVDTRPGEVVTGTGIPALDDAVLPLGRVAVSIEDEHIRQGFIAISGWIDHRAIRSVVLEEMTQALGLLTDIRSPAYRLSIFSEDGNAVTRLTGQDAMAIRRHYAGDGEGERE